MATPNQDFYRAFTEAVKNVNDLKTLFVGIANSNTPDAPKALLLLELWDLILWDAILDKRWINLSTMSFMTNIWKVPVLATDIQTDQSTHWKEGELFIPFPSNDKYFHYKLYQGTCDGCDTYGGKCDDFVGGYTYEVVHTMMNDLYKYGKIYEGIVDESINDIEDEYVSDWLDSQ